MILRMLLPWWAMILIFVPMLGLVFWQLGKARGAVRWAWLRRFFVVVLLAGMVACPAVPEPTEKKWVTSVEVYFVVDLTGSMAAEDYGENHDQERLDGVRHDMDSITDGLPGSRYSVITFDSESIRSLPLTSDARAVKSLGATMTREISTLSTGSNVDRALPSLGRALEQSYTERPENVRLVYFMSDGENTDGEPSGSFASLADWIDGGGVLGYGTEEGGKMKVNDGRSEITADSPYIQDPKTGGDAISRIDEETLKTIAEQMGVDYTHRTVPDSTDALTAGIDSELIAADGRRPAMTYRDLVWPIAMVLALLLVWEVWYLAIHLVAFRDDKSRRLTPAHRPDGELDPLSDDAEQVFVGTGGGVGGSGGAGWPGGPVGAGRSATGGRR